MPSGHCTQKKNGVRGMLVNHLTRIELTHRGLRIYMVPPAFYAATMTAEKKSGQNPGDSERLSRIVHFKRSSFHYDSRPNPVECAINCAS